MPHKDALKAKEYFAKRYQTQRALGKFSTPEARSRALEVSMRYYWRNRELCNTRNKSYRKRNIEAIRVREKLYRKEQHELVLERTRLWQKRNPDKVLTYAKNYLIEQQAIKSNYYIAFNLRRRLGSAIRKQCKAGSAVRDLGCSIDELKSYISSKFSPGMTWDNWGRAGWHIDHIKPLCSFDLSQREQLLKAVHYTNLQPLWAKDNLKKGRN